MKTTECWVKAGRKNSRYVTHSDLQSHRHTQTETQTVRHTSDRLTGTRTQTHVYEEYQRQQDIYRHQTLATDEADGTVYTGLRDTEVRKNSSALALRGVS